MEFPSFEGAGRLWVEFRFSKVCTLSSSPLPVQSLLSHPSPVQCGSILNNLLGFRNLQFFNFVVSKAWGGAEWNFEFRRCVKGLCGF